MSSVKVKVRVTQEHINKGRPHDACGCPISLAMGEAIPGKLISVGLGDAAICEDGKVVGLAGLTYRAKHFVHSFDLGYKVEPFEFESEVTYHG